MYLQMAVDFIREHFAVIGLSIVVLFCICGLLFCFVKLLIETKRLISIVNRFGAVSSGRNGKYDKALAKDKITRIDGWYVSSEFLASFFQKLRKEVRLDSNEILSMCKECVQEFDKSFFQTLLNYLVEINELAKINGKDAYIEINALEKFGAVLPWENEEYDKALAKNKISWIGGWYVSSEFLISFFRKLREKGGLDSKEILSLCKECAQEFDENFFQTLLDYLVGTNELVKIKDKDAYVEVNILEKYGPLIEKPGAASKEQFCKLCEKEGIGNVVPKYLEWNVINYIIAYMKKTGVVYIAYSSDAPVYHAVKPSKDTDMVTYKISLDDEESSLKPSKDTTVVTHKISLDDEEFRLDNSGSIQSALDMLNKLTE